MNIIKSKITKENPSIAQYNAVAEQFLFMSSPDAQSDRQLLQKLGDFIMNRQLSAEEAMRALKMHIKQESHCSAEHRIRALKVVEYLSLDCPSSISQPVMQQLASAKWKDRLMKAALKSYSPPLQDAIVQLLFKWASIHRKREWGIGFVEMLRTLEAEGIIVEHSWKLGGAKPVVVALLGGAGAGATSPRGAAASSSAAPTESPSGATARQYQETQLLQQAESMTADAEGLSAACKSLTAAGGDTSAVTALRTKCVDLNARCTLHLARLQEALARASLTEVSIAHLCITADTIMEAQATWQSINDAAARTSSSGTPSAAATAVPAASSDQPLTSSRAAPAHMIDLLCLDDDDDVTTTAATTPAAGIAPPSNPNTPAPLPPKQAPATPAPPAPQAVAALPNLPLSTSNPFASALDKAALAATGLEGSPMGTSLPADLLAMSKLPEATLSAPVVMTPQPVQFPGAAYPELQAEVQTLRSQCEGLHMALAAEKTQHASALASQQAYYEHQLAQANQHVLALQERVRALEMQLTGALSPPSLSLPSPQAQAPAAAAPASPWVDFSAH